MYVVYLCFFLIISPPELSLRLNRLYAFDVHCNAYFPLFISLYGKNTIHLKLIYKKRKLEYTYTDIFLRNLADDWNCYAVLHYFLSPLLIGQGILPVIFSNAFFMLSLSYYHYLNFLGYNGKQILALVHACVSENMLIKKCLCAVQFFRFWTRQLSFYFPYW